MAAGTSASSPIHCPAPIPIIETYSLIGGENNNDSSSSRYTAFIIRLTDASSKSLNQAILEAKQKRSKGAAQGGYIELGRRGANNSIEGALCFGGAANVTHRFSLTDAQRDLGLKGQLDVVELKRNIPTPIRSSGKSASSGQGSGCMKSIGPVTQRLQISATTEDTFESTKQKAQQANEELRKNAPKVVKMWQKGNNGQQKIATTMAKRPSTPLSYQHHHHNSNSNEQKSSGTSSRFTNGVGGVGNGYGHAGSGNGAIGGDITKRPLRQRVVYKLFANPSTSIDLLNTLSNEGISDYDRSIFDKTLKEVGQITRPIDSSSNGSVVVGNNEVSSIYELKRSYYNDIRLEDWPFYNNAEKQACRKKLVLYKTAQHSGSSSSSTNNQNGTNNNNNHNSSDDCTQRVSGKVSYRPPPKKPTATAIDNSPPNAALGGNTKSPPSVGVSALSPGSTAVVTTSGRYGGGGGAPPAISDDSTQRVSAKSAYRPPPKKPVVVRSPSNGVMTSNGKSPPAVAAGPALGSPARSTLSSPRSTKSANSPPPKKRPHTMNGIDANRPDHHSVVAATTNGPPAFRQEPNPPPQQARHYDEPAPKKRRQEHRRPQPQPPQPPPPLTASTNNNNNNEPPITNGFNHNSQRHHVASPSPESAGGGGDQQHHWKASSRLENTAAIDFRSEYPEISTGDDRRRYKEEFDREYPTYLKLYERLRTTASEFEKLGAQLKRTTKQSNEYKDIEREIVVKYHHLQQDADMNRSRREHERLRRKLGVIKDRVKEYDDRQLIAPRMITNGIKQH